MTIEVRGKAPNFNGHIVRLALHPWGLLRMIEMIRLFLIKRRLGQSLSDLGGRQIQPMTLMLSEIAMFERPQTTDKARQIIFAGLGGVKPTTLGQRLHFIEQRVF